jgi:hypothetical protein
MTTDSTAHKDLKNLHPEERASTATPPSLETVGCPRRDGAGGRHGAGETWS